jgi:hypothetical protein
LGCFLIKNNDEKRTIRSDRDVLARERIRFFKKNISMGSIGDGAGGGIEKIALHKEKGS